jgi:hypothetical protein
MRGPVDLGGQAIAWVSRLRYDRAIASRSLEQSGSDRFLCNDQSIDHRDLVLRDVPIMQVVHQTIDDKLESDRSNSSSRVYKL